MTLQVSYPIVISGVYCGWRATYNKLRRSYIMELSIAVAMLGDNERKRVKMAVEAPEDYGLGFACGAVAANSVSEGGDVPDDAAAAVTTALFHLRPHNKPAVIAASQAAFLQAFKLLE